MEIYEYVFLFIYAYKLVYLPTNPKVRIGNTFDRA